MMLDGIDGNSVQRGRLKERKEVQANISDGVYDKVSFTIQLSGQSVNVYCF